MVKKEQMLCCDMWNFNDLETRKLEIRVNRFFVVIMTFFGHSFEQFVMKTSFMLQHGITKHQSHKYDCVSRPASSALIETTTKKSASGSALSASQNKWDSGMSCQKRRHLEFLLRKPECWALCVHCTGLCGCEVMFNRPLQLTNWVRMKIYGKRNARGDFALLCSRWYFKMIKTTFYWWRIFVVATLLSSSECFTNSYVSILLHATFCLSLNPLNLYWGET